MKSSRVLLALLLLSPLAVAQTNLTLRGRVTDALTGEPIGKVKIVVIGAGHSASTDHDGAFIISGLSAGKIELYITAVGYGLIKRKLMLGNGETLDGNRVKPSGRLAASLLSSSAVFDGPLGGKRGAWLVAARKSYLQYLLNGLSDDSPEEETFVTDTNAGHYLLGTNRHMCDVLTARGYDYEYVEFMGGHSEVNWEDQFAVGLGWLWSKR